MKTLKKIFACLETLIKKIFFNEENVDFKTVCGVKTDEITKPATDVERMKFEEYISRYKATTRWQTL